MADLTAILNGPWEFPKFEPPEMQLRLSMEDAGLEPPDEIFLDGKIHRFNNGNKKDKSGWYVAFADKIPAGRFGDWRLDLNVPWTADVGRDLDYEEVAARKRHIEIAREIRDKELAKLHDGVAQAVERIWENGTPATTEHPYLKKKGIQPHGMRVSGDGALMIPVHSPEGDLRSIQYIHPQGKKLFHTGGEAGGNVCVLGDLDDSPVFVAEGFATAASIREATGKPVVIAFSAHNMVGATGFVRERNGTRTDIVVVGDNDESGVGQKAAKAACDKYGARMIIPPEEGDANDFAQRGGDLKRLLAPPLDGWLVPVREFAKQPAPITWLIKGWLPSGALMMVHGPSGCGKTFLVLHWSMLIASSDTMLQWEGAKIRNGTVIYLAGEGHHGLRSRVAAWLKYYEVNPDVVDLHVSASGCDLNTPEGWLKVKSHIDAIGTKPVLIVVDTLHRFLHGDENSAQDAKVMIDACAGLQQEYGCSVLLVHHTGVSEEAQHRARGSSAWKAALDMESSVVMNKDKESLQIICRKMKDAEEPQPTWARLMKGIVLPGWYDEDGERVTSAVIVRGTDPGDSGEKGEKLSDIQRIAMSSFRLAAETRGMVRDGRFAGVEAEAWRAEFYKAHVSDSVNAKKVAFQRVRKSLLEKRLIRTDDDDPNIYFPEGVDANIDEAIFVQKLTCASPFDD